MTRVLLTGFEPFGGDTTNPSWEAVKRAAELWDGPETLSIAELPVEFGRSDSALLAAIDATRPDLVVAVGLAGGIPDLHLERVAINLDDARIPDNAGDQPIDLPIAAGGAAAYFTGLPVKAAVRVLTRQGIPASVSHSAGTFVCNHVFYTLMASGAHGGFVHVPYSPGMAESKPSLPVETVARGLVSIVRTALDTTEDHSIGGSLF